MQDPTVQQFQENVRALLEPIAATPHLNGNLIQGVAVSGNTIRVPHNLGRRYQNYQIHKANGPLQVWDLPADNTMPDTYLVLRYSGTATLADFWVY